ncbi:MAG: DUF418 domain-containing protein [Verrucomicrobiales bacterium]|nr:DUF418 domain-containing protein [Verrucomicrobiales bacterium]
MKGTAIDTDGSPPPAPTDGSQRLQALDVLRGFALLGILLMNIVIFGLYFESYDNPTSAGGATGANLGVWVVLHILAEGKMRCLFSLVFGASAILLTSRLDHRLDGADIYFRRTLWLFLFGVVHSFLLWHGEVLYPYAVCGLFLYSFRHLRPKGLILLGTLSLLLLSGFSLIDASYKRDMITDGQAAVAKEARGEALNETEQDAKVEWETFRKSRNPTPEKLEEDAKEWRGSPWQVIQARGAVRLHYDSIPVYHPFMFDMWGMMMIGMGLFKLGILSGERSTRFYGVMAATGFLVGIPITGYTAWTNVQHHFDPVVQLQCGSLYQVSRYAVTTGYMGLLLLLCKTGTLRWLTNRLAAVGRMALSNYLFHSVVCAFLFTGYGFALYGRLERHQLYYVVAALWIFQLIVSPLWLRHFRFGPFEWLWRSLTYWKRQPFRIDHSRQPSVTAPAG